MSLLIAGSVHWSGFDWIGNFTTVDLIAASPEMSSSPRCPRSLMSLEALV